MQSGDISSMWTQQLGLQVGNICGDRRARGLRQGTVIILSAGGEVLASRLWMLGPSEHSNL